CQGDSHLVLANWTEPGAPGAPLRPVTRLYVVCFTSGQMLIVDPDLAIVIDVVTIGQGANAIAFRPEPTGNPPRRAYVSNYVEQTISVLDLERGSSTENRVIARI